MYWIEDTHTKQHYCSALEELSSSKNLVASQNSLLLTSTVVSQRVTKVRIGLHYAQALVPRMNYVRATSYVPISRDKSQIMKSIEENERKSFTNYKSKTKQGTCERGS